MGGWRKVGVRRVGGPEGWGPEGWGPKISRFFFSLSRRKIRSFLPSLGVFSLNFGGVFVDRDPQMCTFGVLRLSCASPSGPVWWGPPGFHTTAREPKCAHLRVPVFKNTTKIQRKGHPKRGKKKERNFGRSGEGRSRGTEHDQTKTLKPPHGNRETNTHKHTHTHTAHTHTHKHTQTHTNTQHKHTQTHTHKHTTQTHKHTQTQVEVGLAKVFGQSRFGQSRFGPKSVLAKVGPHH